MTRKTFGRNLLLGAFALFLVTVFVSCGDDKEVAVTKATVDSLPESGAAIFINGNPKGVTPLELEAVRPGATLLVKLEKVGFKTTAEMITITADDEQAFEIEMIPRVAYLSLETKPSFASVFVNGTVYLGDTPLKSRKIPIGNIEFTIEKENYEPESLMMEVEEDHRYNKNFILSPSLAFLSVFSLPTGAQIWINDEVQPQKTPAIIELVPETYTVGVYSPGYVLTEKAVTLKPAEEGRVELRMKMGTVPKGMVLVLAGEFIRGVDGSSPDELPEKSIFVDAFYVDKYEVTNEEFRKVFPAYVFRKGFDSFPVSGVSFDQATAYARAVGKRLLTEEEWEKAARGTDGRVYPWGNIFGPSLCNSKTQNLIEAGRPKKVGSFRRGASPYGCMDMAGNVYEWTSSWYQAYPGNKDIKQNYGQVYRVLRGGSYNTAQFDVRCACRHFDKEDSKREDYGFRCAKNVSVLRSSKE